MQIYKMLCPFFFWLNLSVDTVGTDPVAKNGNRPLGGVSAGAQTVRDLAQERLLLCTLSDGSRLRSDGPR
jgi:hypothetical protein